MPLIEALKAGVSHVFVNLGSDHPAIMEALAYGENLEGVHFPKVITCPHEVWEFAIRNVLIEPA